jgi:hypothetical protein
MHDSTDTDHPIRMPINIAISVISIYFYFFYVYADFMALRREIEKRNQSVATDGAGVATR